MSSTFTVTTSLPLIVFLRPQPSLNIHSQCCRAASKNKGRRGDFLLLFIFFFWRGLAAVSSIVISIPCHPWSSLVNKGHLPRPTRTSLLLTLAKGRTTLDCCAIHRQSTAQLTTTALATVNVSPT